MAALWKLVVQTVQQPREVARYLLSLGLSSEAVLTAFALVLVLNTIFVSGAFLRESVQGLAVLMSQPPVFLGLLAVSLLAVAASLTVTGRVMGGKAGFKDMLTLLVWLQGLRTLVQAALLVITPISAMLTSMVAMGTSILGLWILLNFIDEAHGLNSRPRAALVLFLGIIAMGVVLSMLLSTLGVTSLEMNSYV